MFVDVIPLLRMPRTTSTFTYRIPSHLEGMLVIGTIVRVPWRGKELFAVVESIATTTTFARTAEIIDRVETQPSWDDVRLKTLRAHAKRQGTSLATLAAVLMPDVPKRAAKPAVDVPVTNPTSPAFHLKSSDLPRLRELAQNPAINHIRFGSQAERLFLYKSWALQASGQVLILTPTLFDAQEIAQFLRISMNKRVLVWGGVLPKSARWKQWTDIRDSQYDIVVATRSGVFVPLQSMSMIIIDQDEDQDHRSWEAAPYYDVRELSQALADAYSIPCKRTSIWPRTETYPHQQWHETPTALPATHVVIHQASQGLLHATVENALEEALAGAEGQVLIVSSQVSAARAYLCLDCQYRWQCSQCGASLQERPTELACDKCGYKAAKPTACPRCDSTRLRGFALGLEALERELPKLLNVPVMRIEEGKQFLKRGILLATPYAWRRWSQLSKTQIKTVLLFQPEKLLFSPDYRAQEWFAHHITWHRVMAQDYLHAPVLIQTDLAEAHPLLDLVLQRNIKDFVEAELDARKRMHLPPYGESLSITTMSTEQEELKTLGARLRADFPNRVYGSVTDRKDHSTSWLIKLDAEHPEELDKLNDSIYSKVLLYRNPETPLL